MPRGRRYCPKTPEERENYLVSLAMDVAEKRLKDGTASNQVITHFLKIGSTKEELEKEKIRRENVVLTAKAEAIESQKRTEELYSKAMDAMRIYKGERDVFED